jgi:hypothetical protein
MPKMAARFLKSFVIDGKWINSGVGFEVPRTAVTLYQSRKPRPAEKVGGLPFLPASQALKYPSALSSAIRAVLTPAADHRYDPEDGRRSKAHRVLDFGRGPTEEFRCRAGALPRSFDAAKAVDKKRHRFPRPDLLRQPELDT